MSRAAYVLREDGCDRCGTQEVEVIGCEKQWVPGDGMSFSAARGKEHLCCFCYETLLGNILQYPSQHPGQSSLVQGLIQSLHILRREKLVKP